MGNPDVSIPFIAGQWSLHTGSKAFRIIGEMFQSPSLRGSGRFRKEGGCFFSSIYVSIPFIAGQWSLLCRLQQNSCYLEVSIPFIAGQWSLLTVGVYQTLFWGIVSIPFIAGQWSLLVGELLGLADASVSFNPLHCGAVVASVVEHLAGDRLGQVSIPFIAGQWSLQSGVPTPGVQDDPGFNPLHCGAVVAS